jgi:hypothetical protein
MSRCIDPDLGALLQPYELHALSDEDTERFRIHLLECQYCFEQFKNFQLESGLLRSDQEVREQVRRAATRSGAKSESHFALLWRMLWPKVPLPLKPVLLYVLLLLLVVPAYRGMVVLVKKEPKYLATVKLPKLRSEAYTIAIEPGVEYTFVDLLEKHIRGDTLDVRIEELDGGLIWQRSTSASVGLDRSVLFTLPQAKLRSRLYKLKICDHQTGECQERYINIVKKHIR